MYLSQIKHRSIAICLIAIFFLLVASPYQVALANEHNILLRNSQSQNIGHNYAISRWLFIGGVFKLSNITTIDPELQLTNNVSCIIESDSGRDLISNELQLALDASHIIESDSGKYLISPDGKSMGPLHIQKQAVDDVNRILGYQAFSYDDRMSWEKSCQIFEVYLNYYGQRYIKQTSKQPTAEVYVRMWNGGPDGWKSKSTENHWQKAEKVIF